MNRSISLECVDFSDPRTSEKRKVESDHSKLDIHFILKSVCQPPNEHVYNLMWFSVSLIGHQYTNL